MTARSSQAVAGKLHASTPTLISYLSEPERNRCYAVESSTGIYQHDTRVEPIEARLARQALSMRILPQFVGPSQFTLAMEDDGRHIGLVSLLQTHTLRPRLRHHSDDEGVCSVWSVSRMPPNITATRFVAVDVAPAYFDDPGFDTPPSNLRGDVSKAPRSRPEDRKT